MEIVNASIVTLNEITKQTMSPLDKSTKSTWICFALIVLCSVLLMLTGDVVFGCVFLGIGILFPLINLAIRKTLKNKIKKANEIMSKGIYYEYVFGDNAFRVSTVSGEHSSITDITYDSLFKVQLFDDMMFFYVNSNSAYIVKNEGFKSAEDRHRLIEHIKMLQPNKI